MAAQERLAAIAAGEGKLDQAQRDEVGNLLALDAAMQREELARGYDVVESTFTLSDEFSGRMSTSAADLLQAEAAQFLGLPYIFGGKTPAGFDCSGLTAWAYREALGIEIGEGTTSQINNPSVAPADLQAGDLVFFNSSSLGPNRHVGIYLGNDEYIHAPRTGDVVKVSRLSEREVTAIRRPAGKDQAAGSFDPSAYQANADQLIWYSALIEAQQAEEQALARVEVRNPRAGDAG